MVGKPRRSPARAGAPRRGRRADAIHLLRKAPIPVAPKLAFTLCGSRSTGAKGLLFSTISPPSAPLPCRPTSTARAASPTRRTALDYQTVFAREPGAIAAPTAGLHFTEAMLAEVAARGVTIARVTLHVGLGTFKPVKSDRVEDHRMDLERAVDPGGNRRAP